ncbi:Crp/Fnr family transcriptional regulator [Aliiroseovarius sp. YM-037]|uniref:Crp/Fnr family transcriptional regulator n=1 Tax=Aliiroseovarius sp. YM-037 TaxID=3341728 RepID=UPI003A7FA90A
MTTDCENCSLRRKDLFAQMSADEVRYMQRFKAGELVIDAGKTLLMEGSNSPQLFTALRGMGLRYKTLEGGQRQVINFIFPGDFIGMQAGLMGEMGHSVEATTQMTLCVFDRAEFWTFFRDHPERAFALTWLAAVEEHLLGDALATVGQRTALAAVAWALVRFHMRATALDMVQDGAIPMPYSQQDLADALGFSLVHTNKTLGKLRDRQMISWHDGTLQLHDLKGLARIAGVELSPPLERPLM